MAKEFIAVAQGHKTGVYNSWDAAKVQVDGYSNSMYRGFNDKNDAQAFVQEAKNLKMCKLWWPWWLQDLY